MDTVLIWLPHRKCIVKLLIGCKYYVKHLNKKILKYFSGSSSTTNEPNFNMMCNCIHELLNVFEDSTQREHTISQSIVLVIEVHLNLTLANDFMILDIKSLCNGIRIALKKTIFRLEVKRFCCVKLNHTLR